MDGVKLPAATKERVTFEKCPHSEFTYSQRMAWSMGYNEALAVLSETEKPNPLEMLLDMDVTDIKDAIGKAHPSIDDMERDSLIEKLDRLHALAFKHMNEAAAQSALGHYERIDRDA